MLRHPQENKSTLHKSNTNTRGVIAPTKKPILEKLVPVIEQKPLDTKEEKRRAKNQARKLAQKRIKQAAKGVELLSNSQPTSKKTINLLASNSQPTSKKLISFKCKRKVMSQNKFKRFRL